MTAAIYAIGDIHGRFDLLQRALQEVARDSAASVTIVFLGDYIDRGPQSREVVDCLMRGPESAGDRWICLKGNHEAMAVRAYRAERNRGHWLSNGGDETLESFGGTLPANVVDWFDRLPLCYETEEHFFVHAGIMPGVPLAAQDEETMLWIRGRFLDDVSDHTKHVVHGHTPSYRAELRHNRTNLDSMAFHTGRLSIGRFDLRVKAGPTRLIEIVA
jgi:serine/threonine protein phosphatase 1